MVHKKYIKVGDKTYGPYYYESYREDGKIKKRYVKKSPNEIPESRVNQNENNESRVKFNFNRHISIFVIVIAVLLLTVTFLSYYFPKSPQDVTDIVVDGKDVFLLAPQGATSGSNGNANLTIWDDTDFGSTKFSGDFIGFYANYTDDTGVVIDDISGQCDIQYDLTAEGGPVIGPEAMSYNANELYWNISKYFSYKGNHAFEISCTSAFGDVTVQNGFVISNTPPEFTISSLTINGVEDIPTLYDFSNNVTDPDINDAMNFSIEEIIGPYGPTSGFNYYWITIDKNTGVLTLDATFDNESGIFDISVLVTDDTGEGESRSFTFDITPVNDAPVFVNLINQEFNMTQLFEYVINVTDEEDNTPFVYNISFVSCVTAPWSTRGSVFCDLFNQSDYATTDSNISISFTPSRDDVGVYLIDFEATDSGNPNATVNVLVNFTVININTAPYYTYLCDNERSAIEDSEFTCQINITDIDELNNLTFTSNQTWFVGNEFEIVNAGSNFMGTLLVNFTATDTEVGNWSINLTTTDTGEPVMTNSTEFYFYVDNVDDAVDLQDIADIIAYTSNNYVIFINTTDDDLLIPDKSVYDENISYLSDNEFVNVNFVEDLLGTNISVAVITFDPNDLGSGVHTIMITAQDANGFSVDSDTFDITVVGNIPPRWLTPLQTDHDLTEDNSFFLDLFVNVTDDDGDPVIFDFSSDTSFPSFLIGAANGIINFAPMDEDVGAHIVEINASDLATPTPQLFNFNVTNVNDEPAIQIPLQGNGVTIDPLSNMNTSEDTVVDIFLIVEDDDLKIPEGQKSYYDEILSVNTSIQGPNVNLFSFGGSSFIAPNKSLFGVTFIPNKTDVGDYVITVNVTDVSAVTKTFIFNLSVLEVQHPPVLMNLSDQATIINSSLYYDINTTDSEDVDDSSGNFIYSYDFLPDGRIDDFISGDESIFNTTSGVLNATFVDGQGGAYHINISVNDSSGLQDHGDFWLFVYDLPEINSPGSGFVFNQIEGNTTNLTFVAYSSAAANLTYYFYINGNLRFNVSYYGDGTPIVWDAVPAYTDETYGLYGNLSLTVAIPSFEFINTSMIWDANITHGNAPLEFVNNIGDKEGNFGASIDIDLKEHFNDYDYFDPVYNQTVDFTVTSSETFSGIGFSVTSDWILSLTASSELVELLYVTGTDYDMNISLTSADSNIFEVRFTEPLIVNNPVPTPSSGGGGGGGSSKKKPVVLKIVLPDPTSARQGDRIVLPITLINEGTTTLKDINLESLFAKDGILRGDIVSYFDIDFIPSLPKGTSQDVLLTIEVNTAQTGLYEITISANVKSPKFTDWGKIYINVEKGETTIERIVFTEEFIAENPECIELNELVEESKRHIENAEFELANVKLREAVDACKETISQRSLVSKTRFREELQDKIFFYLLIATIVAIVLGIAYYSYRIIVFRRALKRAIKIRESNI